MKKILAVLACAGLLTGCGSANSSEEGSSSAKETSSETAAVSAELSSDESTEEETERTEEYTLSDETPESDSDSFRVTAEGVEVVRDGETVQTIAADTASYADSEGAEKFLGRDDFDFDGYKDIFVPSQIGTPNLPGKYFRFDKDTEKYAEWPEMNEKIGALCEASSVDELLRVSETISSTDHTTLFYGWEDGKLVLKSKDVQALADDGKIYVDSYSYSGGAEDHYMRRLVTLDEDGYVLSFEEVPIED